MSTPSPLPPAMAAEVAFIGAMADMAQASALEVLRLEMIGLQALFGGSVAAPRPAIAPESLESPRFDNLPV